MSYLGILLLLNLLILIHEAGHLVAAKLVGIPVAAFSVGLGPKVWSRRWRGTEYALRLLPLGGFVVPECSDFAAFRAVPLPRRIAYYLGGPLANLLSCLPLLAVFDTAARGLSVEATLVAPVRQLAELVGQMLVALSGVFSHPEAASGVVGIVVQGGQLVASGFAAEVALSLSVSLAVMNLLPLPILDGGQILLSCLEEAFPRLVRFREAVTVVGVVLLGVAMVLVTGQDLVRLWG